MIDKIKNIDKKYLIMFYIIIGTIIIDQITKILAANLLELHDPNPIINNFFYLTHHRNHGAAFGILEDKLIIMMLFTVIATYAFYIMAKDIDFDDAKLYSIGLSFMVGGMIGNLYDRLLRDGVVDFLDFIIFGYDFAIFNFADVFLVVGAIMVGTGMLIFDQGAS